MSKQCLSPKLITSKRADAQPTGAQAATLVVLITILIIFYLLFIPPDVRDEILEGTGENITDDDDEDSNKTLLLETPGTLEEMEERDIEHLVNSVYIFATEESTVMEKVPALSVKQSWFTDKPANFTFEIEDKRNVENILLSFLAEDRQGTLTIRLNGAEIFSDDVASVNVEPFALKDKQLKEGTNTVEFSVSEVGWAFWKTNKYQLKSVQIPVDIS